MVRRVQRPENLSRQAKNNDDPPALKTGRGIGKLRCRSNGAHTGRENDEFIQRQAMPVARAAPTDRHGPGVRRHAGRRIERSGPSYRGDGSAPSDHHRDRRHRITDLAAKLCCGQPHCADLSRNTEAERRRKPRDLTQSTSRILAVRLGRQRRPGHRRPRDGQPSRLGLAAQPRAPGWSPPTGGGRFRRRRHQPGPGFDPVGRRHHHRRRFGDLRFGRDVRRRQLPDTEQFRRRARRRSVRKLVPERLPANLRRTRPWREVERRQGTRPCIPRLYRSGLAGWGEAFIFQPSDALLVHRPGHIRTVSHQPAKPGGGDGLVRGLRCDLDREQNAQPRLQRRRQLVQPDRGQELQGADE